MSDDKYILLVGEIDRIDVDKEMSSFQVIDYKTDSSKSYVSKEKKSIASLKGGTNIQLGL